jgi:arylsulfatase A-like enzyme
VRRLTDDLRAPVFWLMEGQQQRAALLAPGESRALDVAVPAGSRLRFSLATMKGGPPRGSVEFEVRGDGRLLQTFRLPTRRSTAWTNLSLPLGEPPPRRLEFVSRRADGGGAPVAASEKHPGRWLAVGAPRLLAPVAPAERRILIWISIDTLRADHLGFYGYGRPTSPVLDRLARESVVFDDAVAPASWTLPSLTSQFTSRYPSQHGARLETFKADASQVSIFEVLARSGFSVLGVSANAFVSPKFDTAGGFDTLWETRGDAAAVTQLALDALGHWDGGHLALFVHYMDPHAYYQPPAPFGALFESAYKGPIDGRNFEGMRADDSSALRHVVGLYDGEIAFADREVGRLLEALAGRGLLERALVVLTADHGEEFRDHGGFTHSRTLYQEMLHVPLVLRLPGVAPRRVAAPVSLVDVAPTLLESLGLAVPASFVGRSLLPLARGGTLPERGLIAETEHTLDGTLRLALRRGRTKYVLATSREPGPGTPKVLREELYDLDADPAERRPIQGAPSLPALRQELLAYLVATRGAARAPVPSELTAEDRERLKALGYLQ